MRRLGCEGLLRLDLDRVLRDLEGLDVSVSEESEEELDEEDEELSPRLLCRRPLPRAIRGNQLTIAMCSEQ